MARVIAIVGATASGKSRLGVELASRLDGEIVNADALQVYRGLDIGTDKPTSEVRRRVPHHLIDVLEPAERFSAGEFARRAEEAIAAIDRRGRVAIVVGGSGLYLRALLEGMSPIPRGDAQVRRDLAARLAQEGLPPLRRELERRDPETARRLAPADRQRTLRALEVVLSTGRPLSDWIRQRPFGKRRLEAVRLGLTVPRAILYDRIARRVRDMVDRGWAEEVAAILERGVDPSAPAFQAIGYRQMVLYLTGRWSLDRAIEDTIRATRRYAKRQLTWFRNEQGIRWIPAEDLPATFPSLLAGLRSGGFGGRLAE